MYGYAQSMAGSKRNRNCAHCPGSLFDRFQGLTDPYKKKGKQYSRIAVTKDERFVTASFFITLKILFSGSPIAGPSDFIP